MQLPCGCYTDSRGKKIAYCAQHNGNAANDMHAAMLIKAQYKANYRGKLKERNWLVTGRVRNHGVTAE